MVYRTIVRKHVETKTRLVNLGNINERFNGLDEPFSNIIDAKSKLRGLQRHLTPVHHLLISRSSRKNQHPPTRPIHSITSIFLKDTMALQRSIHSNCKTLKLNGKNLIAWERQINTTLDFVFHTEDFLNENNCQCRSESGTPHTPSIFS
ncbi:uncharacterized protein VP01_219g7 [Puccinia sorghi]|uniref:Uncharacterized protein n=1 Tax=Puccinia sorghi TaxID=27349 RepID=A0A0L6V8X2_9BASI|nr:uncharacterized protein VP01_219g7 [Puccinia sorghi]